MKQHPSLTPRHLETYETLERIRMAWVALWFVLPLFAIGLLSFLYAIFRVESQGSAKTLLGGIDLLLGWVLRTIVSYLYPSPKQAEAKE